MPIELNSHAVSGTTLIFSREKDKKERSHFPGMFHRENPEGEWTLSRR